MAVTIENYDVYVDKTSVQKNGQIIWTINLNVSQSEIENLVITDRLSKGQRYRRGTARIVLAKYNANKPGAILIKDESQEVDIDGNIELRILAPTITEGAGFELKFVNDLQTIRRAYILEYETDIYLKEALPVITSDNTKAEDNQNPLTDGLEEGRLKRIIQCI